MSRVKQPRSHTKAKQGGVFDRSRFMDSQVLDTSFDDIEEAEDEVRGQYRERGTDQE